eukprot:340439-Chlamydomonas_euryale.AAC.1
MYACIDGRRAATTEQGHTCRCGCRAPTGVAAPAGVAVRPRRCGCPAHAVEATPSSVVVGRPQ